MRRFLGFYACAFVVGLLAGVGGSDLRAACDTKCRSRMDFFLCNGAQNSCLHYAMPTCAWCELGGGCTNGDAPEAGTCKDDPNATVVPMYFFSPCTSACDCPNYQTYVEAAEVGGGAETSYASVKKCRTGRIQETYP